MRRLFATLALGLAIPAHAGAIDVSVTYRVRMAVPPGVVLDVRLLGPAAPGGPPETLVLHRVPEAGNPPWPVSLPHDGPLEGLRVAATLRTADGARFFEGEADAGTGETEVVLHPASGEMHPMVLIGPRWRLFLLEGEPVPPLDGQRDIPWLSFDAEGRVHGSSGCNMTGAGYTQPEGAVLRFTQGFGTMMACAPEVMAREQALLEVLGRSNLFAIDGDRLSLLDGTTTLALFVAEPMS